MPNPSMPAPSSADSSVPFDEMTTLDIGAIEIAFDGYFERVIRPILSDLERSRRMLRWEASRPYRIVAGVLAGIWLVLFLVDSGLAIAYSILLMVVLLFLGTSRRNEKSFLRWSWEKRLVPYDARYRAMYRSRVNPAIGAFFGSFEYFEGDDTSIPFELFALPDEARSGPITALCGKAKGSRWGIAQFPEYTTLSDSLAGMFFGSGSVSSGSIVAIGTSAPGEGLIIIAPERGRLGNWLSAPDAALGLSPVRLEDPRFEDRLEVFASDQVGARLFLTPSRMEHLERFLAPFGETKRLPVIVRSGAYLYLGRIEEQNYFRTGSIYRSAADARPTRALFEFLRDVFVHFDGIQR
jgi:hypothetical protein